jgi:RHH-type rel operon transcriptional repressor/antitoxin RelB
MSKSVSVRLSDDLADRLEVIVKETERSRSFIVQKALEVYLADFADLQVAMDRLRDKSDKVVTADELRESLDL